MLTGFSYVFGQVAVLLVPAVAVGIVAGRYAWPRRSGARPLTGTPDPVRAGTGAGAASAPDAIPHADSAARLTEAETRLAEARRRLTEADAALLRMRAQAQVLADQKETEMGRLESGAITALEATMSAHRERVTGLEIHLQAAEETARLQMQQLDLERRRSAQLQAALAERDQHLATLRASANEHPDSTPRPEAGAAR
jgi:hypothetical protein